ncbi:glycine-rich protein [Phytophthora infestans T30-4]|uniref:Glycine-rich protein n=1 Tax=Phytophthora infestans (strain T30-4) TaxID=403677 RepID=D0NL45_PHYIT|nr:glycine-rich protein [Phytophthora infestans T30-4]EEY60363.1 glycine-rich protein [Phytophthora infestans T30-4]|eukprot:XP_002900159.1 glycine-rich protein [Phytophthora infestans T30-4]
MFSSSKIAAVCLAVVALTNSAYAEKEAAQTLGLLGAGLHGGAGLYGAGAAGLHGGAGVGAGLYGRGAGYGGAGAGLYGRGAGGVGAGLYGRGAGYGGAGAGLFGREAGYGGAGAGVGAGVGGAGLGNGYGGVGVGGTTGVGAGAGVGGGVSGNVGAGVGVGGNAAVGAGVGGAANGGVSCQCWVSARGVSGNTGAGVGGGASGGAKGGVSANAGGRRWCRRIGRCGEGAGKYWCGWSYDNDGTAKLAHLRRRTAGPRQLQLPRLQARPPAPPARVLRRSRQVIACCGRSEPRNSVLLTTSPGYVVQLLAHLAQRGDLPISVYNF